MATTLFELGLLGHEISYSLSPEIHTAQAKALGHSIRYSLYDMGPLAPEVREGEILNFLQDFFKNPNALGLNVTKPYKNLVARLTASHLASVNTLYRRDGDRFWRSASTDGEGFLRAVRGMGLEPRGWRRLVFLGAGGSVLGILETMSALGICPAQVFVLRRSDARDGGIRALCPGAEFLGLNEANLAKVLKGSGVETFLVQATSAPQQGDYMEGLVSALAGYGGGFMDLVYGRPSALVGASQARGLKATDGLGMLVEQARCSHELWWGRRAS